MMAVVHGAGEAEQPGTLSLIARCGLVITPWISGLAMSGLNPVLKPMSDHFAAVPDAATMVRLLVTVVGGAMVFGAPLGGFLAERFGERRVLLWALAIYAVAGTAGYFLDGITALLGTRIVLGLANGAVGVCAATIITLGIPGREQSRWLGIYTAVGTVGSLIILPTAGLLGGINWRYVFPLHLVALPILLFVLATVPDMRAGAARRAAASSTEPRARGGFPLGLVLVGVACGVIGTTLPVYLPFHLAEMGQGRPERIAAAMVPTMIATGVVSLAYGWVRARMSVAAVFALGFLLSALGLAAVFGAPVFSVVLVGTFLSGLGLGLLAPNLFGAAAAAATPDRRARVMGLVRAGFFSGPMVAQLPLEPITAAQGPGIAIATLAAFALVATGAVLLARRSFVPAGGVAAAH